MNPKLIIADECISALDVSIQAQVVNLMKDIQQETGTAYLFIAHDLSMVKYISDRIGVLHLGHLLETGTTEEIFENPIHPYTKSLLSAIPAPNPVVEKNRVALSYDYKTSGIDYNKGTDHLVSGTHYVKCTDEEFKKWTDNIAGNHHKSGSREWWFSFLVKVLNFFAWDVLNIMRKVEYEKLNRNRIDFENGIWYIRVKIQKFNRERK